MHISVKQRIISLAFCLFIFISCSSKPTPSYEDNAKIDLSGDPEMQMIENLDTLKSTKNGIDWTVKLKATYRIRAIVLSRRNYGGGWNAILSPCDLALAWGNLTKDNLYKKIKWSQNNRWYFWRYGDDFSYDNGFINRYSSNNHIIPATPNLTKTVKFLRRNDIVELTGYLVDIDAKKGNDTYWWNSSTSLTDAGDGSCEVLYLVKLKVGNKIYQ